MLPLVRFRVRFLRIPAKRPSLIETRWLHRCCRCCDCCLWAFLSRSLLPHFHGFGILSGSRSAQSSKQRSPPSDNDGLGCCQ
jgi:hypothetical protein